MSPDDRGRLGPTRVRDLAAVAVVAAVAGYALTRFNYSRLPTLPRLAGVSAAVIGVAEAAVASVLRRRIRLRDEAGRRARGEDPADRSYRGAAAAADPLSPAEASLLPEPVSPLAAARMLGLAKASALAGAALAGLWVGVGVYVLPDARRTGAAAADSATAVVGLLGAAVLLAGALVLEYSLRAPDRQ